MKSLIIAAVGWAAVAGGCVWMFGAVALIVWGAATAALGVLVDWEKA